MPGVWVSVHQRCVDRHFARLAGSCLALLNSPPALRWHCTHAACFSAWIVKQHACGGCQWMRIWFLCTWPPPGCHLQCCLFRQMPDEHLCTWLGLLRRLYARPEAWQWSRIAISPLSSPFPPLSHQCLIHALRTIHAIQDIVVPQASCSSLCFASCDLWATPSQRAHDIDGICVSFQRDIPLPVRSCRDASTHVPAQQRLPPIGSLWLCPLWIVSSRHRPQNAWQISLHVCFCKAPAHIHTRLVGLTKYLCQLAEHLSIVWWP